MPHIVLTEEQSKVLEEANDCVELRTAQGRVVGKILPLVEQEILERVRQSRARNAPSYPAHEVEARLRRLEEIRQSEGMDEAKMRELLRRMRAGEVV